MLKGLKLGVFFNFEIIDLRNYLIWIYGFYNFLKFFIYILIDNFMLILKLNFVWLYRNVIEFLLVLKDYGM